MRKNKPKDPDVAGQANDVQLDVLLSLVEAPLRSSDLVSAVEAIRGDAVPLATFYRQLQRAAGAGWVEATGDGPATGRGRPERRYRLTEAGSRVLRRGLRRYGRRVERARALGLLTERSP